MEIEGVNTTRKDQFPFSALRVLGSLQVFLGGVCVVLGIVDLALMLLTYDDQASLHATSPDSKKTFETMVDLTVASSPIWCGTWYMVTGSLGACVSREKSHSLSFLRIAFLVLSVLCSAFFAPACTVLSGFIAVYRHTLDYSNLAWLGSTAAAFLSFFEIGIAICSASVCCCCSPLSTAKVHILFADNNERDNLTARKLPPIRPKWGESKPMPETTKKRKTSVRQAKVQTEPPKPLFSAPQHHGQPRRLPDPRYPILQRPRTPETERSPSPQPPSTSGSMGYHQLRKWALPHD